MCLCIVFYIHYTIPSVENRLLACSQRGLVKTTPVPSLASDFTYSSASLVGGVQSGLDAVSHAVQETRDKSRRQTHSAGTAYHHNASNLPKPAGNLENMV